MSIEFWNQVYVHGFALSTTALLAWLLVGPRSWVARVLPVLVVGGLTLWFAGLAVSAGSVPDKLFLVGRDLVLQALTIYLVGLLKKHPNILVPALILAYLFYYLYGREAQLDYLQQAATPTGVWSAPGAANTAVYELDPDAELLVLVNGEAQLASFARELEQRDLPVPERAFPELEADWASREPGSDLARTYTVDLPAPADADRVIAQLQALGLDLYVEHNEQLRIPALETTAQAPLTGPQNPADLGLDDPYVPQQWSLTAWPYAAFAKTSSALRDRLRPARLFVLDSGVDATHEDLSDNYRSLNKSYDRDPIGHGTHVAGIAAGVARNKRGIAGWFPAGQHEMTVTSVRVLNALGAGTQRSIIAGILEAADAGAAVINLSLGGFSTDRRQRLYADAVKYANARGAIVVAAAGNSAADARRYSPANTPGVIAVAALDNKVQHAGFSNRIDGLEMGVYAPGQAIVSTVPNNGYVPFSGTSMAAPQVSGLLTVAKAIRPELTTREAYRLLNRALRPNESISALADTDPGASPSKVIEPGTFLDLVAQ